MLTIIAVIALLWLAPKLLLLGIRAAWGIAKIICLVGFLPLLILGLLYIGLKYIAIPLLVIAVVVVVIGRLAAT